MSRGETTKIRKIGTSLGVIIPVEVLRAHGMSRGDEVIFGHIDADTIAIRKLPADFYINYKPH